MIDYCIPMRLSHKHGIRFSATIAEKTVLIRILETNHIIILVHSGITWIIAVIEGISSFILTFAPFTNHT